MPDKFVRASRPLNKLLKHIFRLYLNLLFDLKFDDKGISGLTPPYAIIANHVNFWDPFIVSLCIPEPVYFVASDAYFRNPLLRWLLKLVGAIPKTKFVTDPQTIRSVMEVSRHSGVIGIFPEGRRSWDGKTLPLRYPTAKLIKALYLPVVSILLEGACLALPRWAAKPRKGEIKVSYNLLIAREEVSSMPTEVIYEKITAAVENDEYKYQKKHMNPYRGHKLAERLELFLFICPQCHSISTLGSQGNLFSCKACNYTVTYDEYGLLKTNNETSLFFDNPRDWNIWQLEQLKRAFSQQASSTSHLPVFEDENLLALTGARLKPLVKLQSGKLSMYMDKLVFTGASGKAPLSFNISRIHGENIQANNKLEFYYDKVLYRFTRSDKCLSAYKWVKAIEIAKDTIKI